MLKKYINAENYETTEIIVSTHANTSTTQALTTIRNISDHYIAFRKMLGEHDDCFLAQTNDISQDNIEFVLAPGASVTNPAEYHVESRELKRLGDIATDIILLENRYLEFNKLLNEIKDEISDDVVEEHWGRYPQKDIHDFQHSFACLRDSFRRIYNECLGVDADNYLPPVYIDNRSSFPDTKEANDMMRQYLEQSEHNNN